MIRQYEGKFTLHYTDGVVHTVDWIVNTDDGEDVRTLKKGRISYLLMMVDGETKYLFVNGRWEARPLLGRMRDPMAFHLVKALIGLYNGKKVKEEEL